MWTTWRRLEAEPSREPPERNAAHPLTSALRQLLCKIAQARGVGLLTHRTLCYEMGVDLSFYVCGKLLCSNKNLTHDLIRQCNIFMASLDFPVRCQLHIHRPHHWPPGLHWEEITVVLLSSLPSSPSPSMGVWKLGWNFGNWQRFLILYPPWGCLRPLGSLVQPTTRLCLRNPSETLLMVFIMRHQVGEI